MPITAGEDDSELRTPYIGSWFSEGEAHLDATVIAPRDEAMFIGRLHGQKFLYSFLSGKDVLVE